MTSQQLSATSLSTSNFYVIGYAYSGPNPDQNCDFDHFDISTEPAVKNLSREPIENGWAGTTNDVSCTAHGRFDTLDEAREAVLRILGDDYRQEKMDDLDAENDGVVERYRVNRRDQMTASESVDWCRESVKEVEADTTHAEIEEKIALCVRENDDQGGDEIDRAAVREAMRERRDEKREEAAEEDEDASDDGEFEDDYVARHDAAEDALLAAKKVYEDEALAVGATWQEGQFHPTLGFELDAKGDIVEDGDDHAVARVEVRYPGRGKVDATVRPYEADGSNGETYDYQFDQHLNERDIEVYSISEPVALNDARDALEAWQSNRDEAA